KVIPFKEIKALLAKIENKDEISLPKYPNSEPKTEPVPEVLPDQAEIDNQKQPKSIPEIEKENVGGTDKDALNLIHGIMDKTYQGYQRHQQYQAEIDNQKQPKSIPEVKSLKKHRERQRIKEKGLEIKNRNYGISNMAIAENLHRQKSFQKYSVETLRKYYISSYWYDGKEYK
ncbi:MAG TPA: hypothetical protein PLB60_00220, partial [Candidatus Marinimicrobia bacterium]|nr:hypothetical protein [Candidatus Neomarinimicrobiota bacterium]